MPSEKVIESGFFFRWHENYGQLWKIRMNIGQNCFTRIAVRLPFQHACHHIRQTHIFLCFSSFYMECAVPILLYHLYVVDVDSRK